MNDKDIFLDILKTNPCPFRKVEDGGKYYPATISLYCEMKRFFTADAFVVFQKDCKFCPLMK